MNENSDDRCSCGDCGQCEQQYEDDMTRDDWDIYAPNCPCEISPHEGRCIEYEKEPCIICGCRILIEPIHQYKISSHTRIYHIHLDCLRGPPCEHIWDFDHGPQLAIISGTIIKTYTGEMLKIDNSSHYNLGG